MNNNKTATLTLRIVPKVKERLKLAALREHRSIANMVEVLILDYCSQNKIADTGNGDEMESNQLN